MAEIQDRHLKQAEVYAATRQDGDRVFFDVEIRDRIAQALADQEKQIAKELRMYPNPSMHVAADRLERGDLGKGEDEAKALRREEIRFGLSRLGDEDD